MSLLLGVRSIRCVNPEKWIERMNKSGILHVILCMFLVSCNVFKAMEEEDPARRVVSEHAKKQKNRYAMKLVASRSPELQGGQRFSLHYLSQEKMEIPQVRKLIVLSIEEFLNMVNADQELQPYLPHHPITTKHLNFRIGFGDIEGQFAEPPYVAYVYLAQDKICYCFYDNLFGKFTEYDDIEESYEEALQLVINK